MYLPAVIWLPSPPSTLLISSGGGGRRRTRSVRRGANGATSVGRRDKALGDDVCAALTDSDRRPLVGGVDSVRVSEGGAEKMFFRRPRQEMLCENQTEMPHFFPSSFFMRVCAESIYDFAEFRDENVPRGSVAHPAGVTWRICTGSFFSRSEGPRLLRSFVIQRTASPEEWIYWRVLCRRNEGRPLLWEAPFAWRQAAESRR